MSNRPQRFENLLQISHRLNYTDDLDSILERILAEARFLTESEAGTIYLRDGDELVIEHTQNDLLFTSNRVINFRICGSEFNERRGAGYSAKLPGCLSAFQHLSISF